MKLTHVYDLGPEPRRKLWEGPFFRHEGTLRWECVLCGEEGSGSFKTVSAKEDFAEADLIDVLCLAEADHAIRCSGSIRIRRYNRHKYVQYSRADVSFDRDGTPSLFVLSANRAGPGHYEAMSIFDPYEPEEKP